MATVTRPAGPSTLAAFRAIVAGRRTDPDFFVRAARKHPRIAHVRLGSEHLYLLSHPDLVRRLLVDAGRTTTKSRGLQAARRVLADGLLTSEDPLHHRQRRLVQPAFHAARVASYAAGMVTAADSTAAGWRDGARVDMAEEMSALTFDAVGRALFSSDLRGAAGEVRAALGDLLSAYHRSFLPGFDLALRVGTPLGRRVTAAQARLDAVVARIIAGHREQGESADLLSALMAARDDGGGMDDRQLRDEVMTLILAGHETTATTLTFVWHLLSTHPAAERWLHEEIDEVIGARTPSPADLGRLPRARSVVAESLRLYPPAWVLGRRLTAEMEVDGWLIPPGSTCLVSQWVLHRDPRLVRRNRAGPAPLCLLPVRSGRPDVRRRALRLDRGRPRARPAGPALAAPARSRPRPAAAPGDHAAAGRRAAHDPRRSLSSQSANPGCQRSTIAR